METAYDRLEWDFIRKCLHKLGFHPQWIQWIIKCISSVSYSLLINGEPKGLFQPSRDIRQGDPLSPYIFILCIEVLTISLVKEATMAKSGIRIKICPKSQKIRCLLFADDCLLFCKSNQQTSTRLKLILDQFCMLSRQLVNFHKYVLTFFKNITSGKQQTTMCFFNIPKSRSLGTYLGCPDF